MASICSGATAEAEAVSRRDFCFSNVFSTHPRYCPKTCKPAAYEQNRGTVTVTPFSGCTLTLIRLARALFTSRTGPISGSL